MNLDSNIFFSEDLIKEYRMVPGKTWVSENFDPISKSRKRL